MMLELVYFLTHVSTARRNGKNDSVGKYIKPLSWYCKYSGMWLLLFELMDCRRVISWDMISFFSSGQVFIRLYLAWSILANALPQKRYNTSSESWWEIWLDVPRISSLMHLDTCCNSVSYTAAHITIITRIPVSRSTVTLHKTEPSWLDFLPDLYSVIQLVLWHPVVNAAFSRRKALQYLCHSSCISPFAAGLHS